MFGWSLFFPLLAIQNYNIALASNRVSTVQIPITKNQPHPLDLYSPKPYNFGLLPNFIRCMIRENYNHGRYSWTRSPSAKSFTTPPQSQEQLEN